MHAKCQTTEISTLEVAGNFLTNGDGNVIGIRYMKPPTFDEWARDFEADREAMRESERGVSSALWRIGDRYNYGEEHFPESSQPLDPNDYALPTIMKAAWICARVPHKLRVLPITYYHSLARFEPKEIERWVAKIQAEKLTRAQVRKLVCRKPKKVASNEATSELANHLGDLDALRRIWHRLEDRDRDHFLIGIADYLGEFLAREKEREEREEQARKARAA